MVIKGFRAYRKPQTFSLGADVTVLYGPNGFGKTSVFDAIDFAATGEIGRMKSSSDALFEKTAKHLDSKAEESAVSLSFSSNGAVRKVTRRVSARKQALLDGRLTDRKTILAELTGGDFPSVDRVENFVSLFRATHLFSQEHQELTKDFHNDCQLSEKIVSRLLAFEDYTNAVNKATKVREILQSVVDNAAKDIRELSEKLADEKAELDRLGRSAQIHSSTDVLHEAIETLRTKVSEAGVSVTIEGSELATVRGWRAAIEVRHAEAQARIDRLTALAKDVTARPGIVAELARIRRQLVQKEAALETVDKKQIAVDQELQQINRRLAKLTTTREAVQARAGVLEWIRATKPVYTELLKKDHEITDELKRVKDVLAQDHHTETRAASKLRIQDARIKETAERLATKRAELGAVQTVIEATTTWRADHTRLVAVGKAERDLVELVELLVAEERDIASQLPAITSEEARLTRHIAEVDHSQSELRRLLSQLQGHVHSGTCPLCGEDLGSMDELLRRIHKQVTADAASDARVARGRIQAEAKSLSERLALNKEKRDQANAGVTELREERVNLKKRIRDFEKAAGKVGAPIDNSVTTHLHARYERIQQEIATASRQVEDLNEELQTAHTTLTQMRSKIASMDAEVSEKEAKLEDIQAQMRRLREDPRTTQLSLDIDLAQLTDLEHLNVQELTAVNADVEVAAGSMAQGKARRTALRQESDSLKAELSGLRDQVANLQKTAAGLTARLEESKLPPDANERTVLELMSAESHAQAQFLELRDLAASIELAIDTEMTAAALTRLRQNVLNTQRAVTRAIRKSEQHQPWLKYFDALSILVSAQQHNAVADFTREYGPRTSVIQRRLRSVYGFDEVYIHSHESTIRVRVKRRGKELRPTDYFSQSQQQTLLLGLFLTTCLSQTWSALSPVLLDDPVTHFDDLNTYAFLDLIVGLLESESENRQFIISTCDEKFLQLARQKFSHLGERATFYTFSAISADGPVVEEVTPSLTPQRM